MLFFIDENWLGAGTINVKCTTGWPQIMVFGIHRPKSEAAFLQFIENRLIFFNVGDFIEFTINFVVIRLSRLNGILYLKFKAS